jgi:two-component system OmpR family response regulator
MDGFMKIIVVEDQIDLQEELVYFLCRTGYKAVGVSSGAELDQALAKDIPDLLLLDIGLPGEDGISIANRLARTPGLSIVMLTARSGQEDRIRSFEGGADNYLVKPVNYRELQAVLIRAVQRNLPIPRKPLSWQLKRHDRLLQSPSSFEVALTGVEVCLLETMLRQPGKTASRRELIEAMGHDFLTFDERRIEVRISRLRKKIRDSTSNEDPLQSEWGVGYAFAAPCEIV